jgi:hypothetical protein
MLKVGHKLFLALTPSVKWALVCNFAQAGRLLLGSPKYESRKIKSILSSSFKGRIFFPSRAEKLARPNLPAAPPPPTHTHNLILARLLEYLQRFSVCDLQNYFSHPILLLHFLALPPIKLKNWDNK